MPSSTEGEWCSLASDNGTGLKVDFDLQKVDCVCMGKEWICTAYHSSKRQEIHKPREYEQERTYFHFSGFADESERCLRITRSSTYISYICQHQGGESTQEWQ